MRNIVRHVILCLIVYPTLLAAPFAAAEQSYIPLPDLLRVTQESVMTNNDNFPIVVKTYPRTANTHVNAEMKDLVDRLSERLYDSCADPKSVYLLDTGATSYVTGTRTASFLLISHELADRKQTKIDFATRVYDLETGGLIALSDFFNPSCYPVIAAEIESQLTAYFPDEEPDEEALSALLDYFAIESAAFVLTPAQLQLTYRADALYAGKNTLMHVRIPYAWLYDHMTALARKETDNSHYRTAALTFDDGPAVGVTRRVLTALRDGGAVGTFFNLGERINNNADLVQWEHDAGHTVASHTYRHDYHKELTADRIAQFRDRFAQEQEALIGVAPPLMRAPGGNDLIYQRLSVDLPIIHWNCLTGDAAKKVNVDQCVSKCIYLLKDHSNILMHNIRETSVELAKRLTKKLAERGYLFVTAEEQLLLNGVPLEKNAIYYGTEKKTVK